MTAAYGATRPHSDGGLQPERTLLAWSRTAVSFLVAAAIMLRWAGHFGMSLAGPLVICVVVALGIIATQRARYRRQAQGITETGAATPATASAGVVLLTAAVTAALALGALTVVLFT